MNLSDLAVCGNPDCSGNCDTCEAYDVYDKEMDQLRKNCKREQFVDDAITQYYGVQDMVSEVNCRCKLCNTIL